MDTQRWLIEYDVSANVQHFMETASAQRVHIIGVYPGALVLIAEASEKGLQRWVATLAIRSVRSNVYPNEEIRQEENPHRREVMNYWNHFLTISSQKSHPHEGLSWDHPGFSPPGHPDAIPGNAPD